MTERLTLALPKGRLLDGALGLLRDIGVDGIDADSRRLIRMTQSAKGRHPERSHSDQSKDAKPFHRSSESLDHTAS